jgi:hypothetical protein
MLEHMVVGGDSMGWGQELKDRNSRYFKLISDRFDFELHDTCVPGLNNEMICRYTIDCVDELLYEKNIDFSKILVCVAFSYPDRIPFFNKKSNTFLSLHPGLFRERPNTPKKLYHQILNYFPIEILPSDVENYYNSQKSIIYFQYNLVNWIYFLQLFLEKKNIKYIFAFNDKHTFDYLIIDQSVLSNKQMDNLSRTPTLKHIQKDINYDLIFTESLEEMTKKNNYSRGPGSHPLEKAHLEYSKLLGNFIQEKILNDQ